MMLSNQTDAEVYSALVAGETPALGILYERYGEVVYRFASQQWQELLADYVLGDVTPEEAETVHQLLLAHPELQGEVNRLQETLALLPLALPESSPPKTLKTNILRLAQANPANSIVDSLRRQSKLRFFALGSVALSIILGLGFSNYRLHEELALVQADLAQYQQAIAVR